MANVEGSRWSLRARLTALAIGASCITALIGATAVWSNQQVAEALGFMQEQRVKPLVRLDVVGRRLERQRAAVLATLASTDDLKQQELVALAGRDAAELPAMVKGLREAERNIQQKALLARLSNAIDKSRDDGLAEVLAKLRGGQFVEADVSSQTRYRPQVEAATQALDEVLRAEVALAERDYGDAARTARWQEGFIAATVAIALAAGIALAAIVGRAVQRALGAHEQELARGASRVASGRLGDRIAVATGDRDSVAASLNAMSEEFSALVREVAASTDAVAQTAARLAQGSNDLSLRTSGQAANLEQTAASTEEFSTTVAQNAHRAEEARKLAASASELAIAGGAAMERVESTMTAIVETSRRIAEIASVIDGMAFQTNILALNAAVEAARAGEHGRGFAVVASEVRTLSDRSAKAAREIRTLVDESAKRSRDGLQGVVDAAGRIRSIVEASRGVTGTVSDIAAATREQAAGIQQLNDAIAQLESATQGNAGLAERTARDAQDMSERAAAMVRALERFSLDETERETAEVLARAAHTESLGTLEDDASSGFRGRPRPLIALR